MTLREELIGRRAAPPRPAPYRLLAPAGWRRVPAEVLTDVFGETAVERLKEAGRPDLVLQMRGMLSQLRRSLRSTHVFEAYLPPTLDGDPQPAVLTVAPFVRPSDVSWAGAVARAARGAEVVQPDFTATPMWRWANDHSDRRGTEEPAIRTRAQHYVVPVGVDASERRGLHFVHTVLAADDTQPALSDDALTPTRLTELLLETGDVILSTFRWTDVED
ncbi:MULTISPECIES: hypothetical protein [unclassified Microbacterium]|uniref:hypothetical protein n=1 Tax=unclassified Microbacterium TaxID=2609290 RepID=UPI00105807F7|nr:hypothetical protein [Microbacterium sp. Gd 4-13]